MKKSLLTLTAGSLLAALPASGQFAMTEIYMGVSGPDLTADWFELTNTSGSSQSTSGLYYDDESADPTEDFALGDLTLAPGESGIFLIDVSNGDLADEITAFGDAWGVTPKISNVPGGSGLGDGGDAAFVFDGNTAGANVVASLSYPDIEDPGNGDGFRTYFSDTTGTTTGFSVDGQDGAFESLLISGNDDQLTVGSPGAIPEPDTFGALAGALALGFAALRRRRRS